MTSKRDELLRALNKAAELGIPAPPDVLLQLAGEDTDEKLQALDLTIKPQDLPLFTLTQPGAVPAPHRPGLILTSTGWALPPKIPTNKPPVYIFGGGGGGGGGTPLAPILQTLGALPDAFGWLHNDGFGNLAWSTPAGGGNVFGSAPTVVNNFAAFDNLTGTLIKDSGFNSGSFDPAGAAAGITLAGLGGQPLNTTLTTLSGLVDAAGMLTNNGAGVLAWTAIPSTHAPVTLDANADTLLSLSTQTLGLDTQTAGMVFAGPAVGVAAVPTFRALAATDIPALSYQAPGNYITSLTTDVTASGPGAAAATIANSAVTLAKMADMATASLIYRKSAGVGAPEVNTLATLKTDLGSMPAAAHDILSASHGDTLAGAVVDGSIIIGNVTPKWSTLAISIPAANVRNVLGVDNGELRPSWKAALDATNPATLTAAGAAAPGTSLVFAHRDHVHAITGAPGLLGNGAMQYQTIITGATPFAPVYSGFLLDGTTGGKTVFAVTNTKTLTLTSTGDFNATFPATGTVAMLNQANSFTLINPLTTIAESWIGPSSTTGVYFKGGFVGIGTITPAGLLHIYRTGAVTSSGGLILENSTANVQFLLCPGIMGLTSTGFSIYDKTNSAARIVINSSGYVGINTGAVTPSQRLDVRGDISFGNTSDGYSRLFVQQKTARALPTLMMIAADDGVVSEADFGGGSVAGYAVKTIRFYTAADNVTQTGTTRLSINSAGLIVIGTQFGTSLLNVNGFSDTQQLTVIGHTTQAVATPIVQFTRNDIAAGVSSLLGLTALGSGANGDGGSINFYGKTSTTAAQGMGYIDWRFINATHAAYTTGVRIYARDIAGARLGLEIQASGSAPMIGFLGAAAVVRPSAWTQTYATASKTVPNMTYAAPAGGLVIDVEGRASLAQLAADVLAYLKNITALIDDAQSLGLTG